MAGDTAESMTMQQSDMDSILSKPKVETIESLDSKDAISTFLPDAASNENLIKTQNTANLSKMDIADDLEISESDDDDDGSDDDNEGLYEDSDHGHETVQNMDEIITKNNSIKEESSYNKFEAYNIDSDQRVGVDFSQVNISDGPIPVKDNILDKVSHNINGIYDGSDATDRYEDPPKDNTIAVKDVKTINETELEVSNIQDDNDNDDDGWMRF